MVFDRYVQTARSSIIMHLDMIIAFRALGKYDSFTSHPKYFWKPGTMHLMQKVFLDLDKIGASGVHYTTLLYWCPRESFTKVYHTSTANAGVYVHLVLLHTTNLEISRCIPETSGKNALISDVAFWAQCVILSFYVS